MGTQQKYSGFFLLAIAGYPADKRLPVLMKTRQQIYTTFAMCGVVSLPIISTNFRSLMM